MLDAISDLITRIRNAQMAKKLIVDSPISNFREALVRVLRDEGYIAGYSITEDEATKRKSLRIELKYYDNKPVIAKIKRISTPGRRVYSSIKSLPWVENGLGIYILSTSKGVMSDAEARRQSCGGEVLCSVV